MATRKGIERRLSKLEGGGGDQDIPVYIEEILVNEEGEAVESRILDLNEGG